MKNEEANKIIADYMGKEVRGGSVWKKYEEYYTEATVLYTSSLDALIPVWEKLDKSFTFYYYDSECRTSDDGEADSYLMHFDEPYIDNTCQTCGKDKYKNHRHESFNPLEAAAIATAKAILELEK